MIKEERWRVLNVYEFIFFYMHYHIKRFKYFFTKYLQSNYASIYDIIITYTIQLDKINILCTEEEEVCFDVKLIIIS